MAQRLLTLPRRGLQTRFLSLTPSRVVPHACQRHQSLLLSSTNHTGPCQHPHPSTSTTRTRIYHSVHHPSPSPSSQQYTNSQLTILSAALGHIPTHGFSYHALTLGARDAGFLDVSVQLLERGEFDLVLFWLASRRGLLRGFAEERFSGKDGMGVEEKVRELVLGRLRMNEGVRERWQEALALMSLAGNIPLSLSELHALSSDILYLAGDTSVDASWYTKRMSVAAIYASAEVSMTRDSSPGMAETQAFVHRRFEDSQAISDKLTGVKQCLGFAGSTAIGLGRSWGLKI